MTDTITLTGKQAKVIVALANAKKGTAKALGTTSTFMGRLMERGWVEVTAQQATGGRAAHVYRLTTVGKALVRRARKVDY